MSVNSNFKDLLSIFNANNVRYPIIEGYAVIRHAEPRYTKDLDIWGDVGLDNANAVSNRSANLALRSPD